MRRRAAPGLQHLLPVIHDLGGAAESGEVVPDPLLLGHVDRPARYWSSSFTNWVESAFAWARTLRSRRSPPWYPGCRSACPASRPNAVPTTTGLVSGGLIRAEGPELPVRQLHGGGGLGHGAPLLHPLQVVLGDLPGHIPFLGLTGRRARRLAGSRRGSAPGRCEPSSRKR